MRSHRDPLFLLPAGGCKADDTFSIDTTSPNNENIADKSQNKGALNSGVVIPGRSPQPAGLLQSLWYLSGGRQHTGQSGYPP